MDSGKLESEDVLNNNNNKEGNTYVFNISNKESSVQIGEKNTMALSTREAKFETQLLRLTSSMLVQLSEMKRSISHLEVNVCGNRHSKKPKKVEGDDCHTQDTDIEDWIGGGKAEKEGEEEGWTDSERGGGEKGYSDDEVVNGADAEEESGEFDYSDEEEGNADAEEESGEFGYSDEEEGKADAEEGQEDEDSGDGH